MLAAEQLDTSDPVNIGTGVETRIADLAETIKAPPASRARSCGTARAPTASRERYLDVSRARELMGFEAEVPLEEGLRRTVDAFRDQRDAPAGRAQLSAS